VDNAFFNTPRPQTDFGEERPLSWARAEQRPFVVIGLAGSSSTTWPFFAKVNTEN